MPNAVRAGPDDASGSPGCSDEEQAALAKLTPFGTLTDPRTIVALLHASVQDFDAEAMALTQPAGAVALSWAVEDADCMVAIRPSNATNVTIEFSGFKGGTFRSVRVYDGVSIATPLIATLSDDAVSQPVTSRSNALLLVVKRDPGFNDAGGFTATYRADNAPPEPSGGVPAASAFASACVPPKRRVSHMCRQCILATIAYTCGPRCAQERLHIMQDGPLLSASSCLPSLADQLAIETVGRLEGAIAQREPFGLSSKPSPLRNGPSLSDLYMPALSAQPVVYVGLDSGNRIVRCDPAAFPGLMVVTDSTEPAASTDCTGFAWLDLRTGRARLQLHPSLDAEMAPFMIHDIPRDCSVVLRSAQPVVGDTLAFGTCESARSIQCWLMRFFGPQAAPQSMPVSHVEFADGLPSIDLVSDVLIRAGQRLSFSGHGGTLRVGIWQVQVHCGGSLNLTRLAVAESLFSSAVVIEGLATFANSTFVDCTARLNAVSLDGLESRGGAISVIGGGRLEMHHCTMRRNTVRDGVNCGGGALMVSAGSAAALVDAELSSNVAVGGRIGAFGGAISVRDGSSLRLVRSTLVRNVADGSDGDSSFAYGGAVFISGEGSVGVVSESEIADNVARAALTYPLGGALYVDEGARLVLTTSRVNRNVAEGGDYTHLPAGGAIFLFWSVGGEIVDCELLENVARGGKYALGGTAPQTRHCILSPLYCLHERCASVQPSVGAVGVSGSRLKMSGSVVSRNRVEAGGEGAAPAAEPLHVRAPLRACDRVLQGLIRTAGLCCSTTRPLVRYPTQSCLRTSPLPAARRRGPGR
jgi:hypothetical protein